MKGDWRIWWGLHWLTVLLVAAWLAFMIGSMFIGGDTGGSSGPDPTNFCEPVSAGAPDC